MNTSQENNFLFSIITAAFNSEPWIETMLKSIIHQSLDFTKHIQLILIDDGSTDHTATIIQHWEARYPENITLVRKKNGGPASARNHGLSLARGRWVTFIDADDFISPAYFQTVHDFLACSNFDGSIAVCNTLLFFDAQQQVADIHPLSFKFKKSRVVNLLEEPDHIQLFVNTCIIRREALICSQLRFDERVKPTFEDAHFLNLLLLRTGDFRLAFIKEAHYFYRKRGAGTGLVEGGWANPSKYRDQILFGYLNLVQQYHRALEQVPAFIQNLIIYETQWYLERLMDGLLECSLTNQQQSSFFEFMSLLFRYIDSKQILLSTLPVLKLSIRTAMLKAFKGVKFFSMPMSISEVGNGTDEVQLRHWSTDEASYAFMNDHGKIALRNGKKITHRFGQKVLCHEYRCWIPLCMRTSLWPTVNEQHTEVFCNGRKMGSLNSAEVLQAYFLHQDMLSEQQRSWLNLSDTTAIAHYRNGWIIQDRVHKADDSGEHFCRWIMHEHPDQPIYFILDPKSQDWQRLEREGFPLVAYRSKEHFMALGQARWLISSHVDRPVIDPMETKTLFGKPEYKVAFLQHGIIKEDLSGWLNQVNLDFMVTSTKSEYDSIIHGRYKFTEREIVLTGLPRHDALLRKSQTRKPGRTILVCPTWREHLRRTEAHISGLNPEEARGFQQSDYFRAWNEVTGSRSLANLAREHGYRFLFLPHPEIVRFLPLFKRSEAFMFLSWPELKSVQDLLANCAIALTDYSSIVFDVAFIGRPVAYYQFQETPDVFSSQRRHGYFSFDKDGMGPVLRSREALEDWLRNTIRHGCVREDPYNNRANAFFTLRDGQNCRRVYEAILARS